MAKDIIIGIDAGTSIIKAVAFTLNGKEIATSSITNIYNASQNGHATQALDTTWENCIKIILDIKKKIQNLKNRLALISIKGQGDGTWLIDKEGNPVCDAWLWLDARSSGVVKELTNLESENSRFNATGTAIFAGQQSAQISFMEKHNPQILNKSTTAFHCKDWIYYKLTKIIATDPSEACFTFGNFRTKNYDKSVINNLGLSKRINLFPDIIDGSKTNHPLINEAANLLDLISGTPVSLAYIDAVCTFLGSGGLDLNKNVGTSILGTTSAHMKASKINDITPNIKLKSGYVMLLPIDNLALQLQTSMSGTLNIDWLKLLLKDIFEEFDINFNNKDFTKKINEWLNRSIPGKIIYHPYISEAGERGPFVNNDAKASIIGLRWNDKFPEMIRSFIEGLCFAARECYNGIGEIPNEIRIVGGGFQSESIRNIFSSVLKVSVRQSNRLEAGATGAAIIGSMSIGLYDDWNSCMDDWINPYLGEVEKHDKELSIIYDKVYKNFLDSRNKIMPLWENINSKIVNNNIN